MNVSQKQIDAIIKLPTPKRYSHFIKKVVGWQRLWGLYNDGWAMLESEEGQPVFPLWPEKEYAELCISGDWKQFKAEPIELEEVLESLIPMLRDRKVLPGVFYTMKDGSINATVDELERDLREELNHYS